MAVRVPWTSDDHAAYIAVNLQQALKMVPCTGDWHCELHGWCAEVLKEIPRSPNKTAEEQRAELARTGPINCH